MEECSALEKDKEFSMAGTCNVRESRETGEAWGGWGGRGSSDRTDL